MSHMTDMVDMYRKVKVGIKQTASNPRYDVWRLTFDGTVLGDSRGYSKDKAIAEAKRVVDREPDKYKLDLK